MSGADPEAGDTRRGPLVERRIVICAPTGQDAGLAAKVLGSVGIGSIVCADNSELMRQLQQGAGALLIVEEVVSGAAMRPLADYVASQPTWSDLPILLLTRSGADSLDVQRAVEHLGNVTLVERPVRTIALITATRSAVRARERQYQVRDADRRKDEFLATLAHELRNPLAPIRTSMGILKHLHPDSSQVTQLRNVVDRQVGHLTRLVDDLLDVARITSGKVALKRERTTLQSVLNHAVEISALRHGQQAAPARIAGRRARRVAGWQTPRAWCKAWPTCWSMPPNSRPRAGTSCSARKSRGRW